MGNKGISNMRNGWLLGVLSLILCLVLAFSVVGAVQADSSGEQSNPYVVRTFIDEDGREIAEIIVPGRPPEIKAAVATVPEPNPAMGINVVSNVPAFDWCYGCSATSAAMLMGYYDNSGYSNMYAGPTNGGVCPMDNTGWGQTPWPSIVCGECPLSATHQDIDGRAIPGHVDDYWIDYLDPGPDPFIDNGPEHTHGDCTGDYMGTSQSLFDNKDGATTFFWRIDGAPLEDYTEQEPAKRDGCHGMRLFAESRAYTVSTNYSQYIYGYQDNTQGFAFIDFQAEIDAGRPVLIQVKGHTMLGYGYDTSGQTVYIRDTWDRDEHSMTWGGTYGVDNRQHYGVTVIQLATVPTVTTSAATLVEETTATLNGVVTNDGGDACQYRFQYDTNSGEPYVYNTGWTGSKTSGQSFSAAISGLSKGTEYYFRAQCKNSAGTSSASELTFLTKPDAPSSFSATTASSTQIDLSWTKGGGAQKTKIRRKQGSYPSNRNDGTQVYFGTGTSKPDTGLTEGTAYYYRTWSYVQGSEQWSDNYAQDWATTATAGEAAAVSIEPDAQEVMAGETFTVDVRVDAGDYDLIGISVGAGYDTTVMTTSEGQIIGHNLLGDLQIGPTVTDGAVTYDLATNTPQADVSGSLLTIEFTVDADAELGDYHITLATATLLEPPLPGVELDAEVTDGTVTVVIGRKGDFDGDGDIDISDFVLFATAYGSELGDDHYNPIGDFDDDADIDIFDFVNFAAAYGT